MDIAKAFFGTPYQLFYNEWGTHTEAHEKVYIVFQIFNKSSYCLPELNNHPESNIGKCREKKTDPHFFC